MTTERTDVLAVLRRMALQAAACRGVGAGEGTQRGEDETAIGAVAELIEVASCGDAVGMADGPDGMYFQPILADRLRAALAGCGSAK